MTDDPPNGLADIAAEIRALAGITDDEHERRATIRNAATDGRHCAECSHEFALDEPVWRFRKFVGEFFGRCYSFAPHCERCASGDWHYFESPRPCAGCGRPVHSTTLSWQSPRVLCCENCGVKARTARLAAARTERRGTRVCKSCGKTFTPTRTDAKFCGAACKQKAYRRRVTDQNRVPRAPVLSRNAGGAS